MFPDQMTLASRVIPLACKVGGITIKMLDSKKRTEQIAFVRQMIAHYLTDEGLRSGDVATLLNRCRSDVSHNYKTFADRIKIDKKARTRYQKLKEAL